MKKLIILFICFTCSVAKGQDVLKQRLDSLTQEYQNANFHGVIIISKNDELIYENAFGFADLDKRIRMTPDKLFKTESVGKMFTATRIMQLVEKGKIDLAKTLAYYLPEWKIKNADKITIHHLLNHTSGLTSTWDDPKYADVKIIGDNELKAIIESQALAFEEPGAQFYYSNSAYILLGEIIAKLDGKPFDESIRENIFRTAGMKNINHLNDTVMPASGAKPYFFLSSKNYIQSNQGVGPKAGPAGGWITSGGELMLFLQAYMKGVFLKPATQQTQLTANYTKDISAKGWHFGYGLQLITDELVTDKTIIGHNGGGAGFSIDAFFEPESGYAILMCSNMYGTGYKITGNYFNLLLDKPLYKVQQNEIIRAVDLIQLKGVEYLKKHSDLFFSELNIRPESRILINIAEQLDELKDIKAAEEVLTIGQKLYPNASPIWLVSGNMASKYNRKKEALAFYGKAKKYAIEEGNDFILNRVNERLEALNNN